jgi:hypothetical protein
VSSADFAFDQPLKGVPRSPGGARDQLVRAKRSRSATKRGLLRPFGTRLPSHQGTKKFAAHRAAGLVLVLGSGAHKSASVNGRPEQEVLSERIGKMPVLSYPNETALHGNGSS